MKSQQDIEKKIRYINAEQKRLSKKILSGMATPEEMKRFVLLTDKWLTLNWVIQ